jgi:hypothetical protein
MQGSDGALYGEVAKFENYSREPATIFKLNTDGSGYSVLSLLTGSADSRKSLPGRDLANPWTAPPARTRVIWKKASRSGDTAKRS